MATSSKTPTSKDIDKRLDTLVQTVQRAEGAKCINGVWHSKCVTCGRVCPITGKNCMQGGHFIPRGCRCTRWLGQNVHPQCTRCNGFLNGNYIMYSRWMQQRSQDDYEHLLTLFGDHKLGRAPKLSPLEKKALYNSWLKKGRELEEKTGLTLFPKSWDYIII